MIQNKSTNDNYNTKIIYKTENGSGKTNESVNNKSKRQSLSKL